MDNITLNKEQLYLLISFIEKKGFKTPLVVVEILDHFACKVEEKMAANPELPLEAAMMAAHADFGVLGFAPIVNAYEAGVKMKYKAIYKAGRRKVIANPLYIIVAALCAFIFYKGYYMAEVIGYKHIFGLNDVGVMLYFSSILFPAIFLFKFKQNRKQNPIINAIILRDKWVIFMIIGISCQSGYHNPRGLMSLCVLGGITVFYYVICLFTMYAAMKKGYKDSSLYYDYLESIHG